MKTESKRIILAVQGEGRGHLTQALAVHEILSRHGHTVCCVIVGTSCNRQIPDFFTRKFSVPVIPVLSPNFTMDKNSKSIHLGRTVMDNLLRVKQYRKSMRTIDALLEEHQPDLVINFYEPLIALHALTRKRSFKILAIAHQYIYLHPAFKFPDGNTLQSTYLKAYTKFTSLGSDIQLAISMYNLPEAANSKLRVCAPLLRKQIFALTPTEEDFVLVYLLNSGYSRDIVRYHKKNPSLKLVCFTDSKEVKEQHNGMLILNENLVFHSLNDSKFLDLMSRCKGLVCTAGFESVCEAMYLNKPVMMVPVKGHYEQYCNARDASRIGAGIYCEEFDLSKLEECFLFYNKEKNEHFRTWVNSVESQLVKTVEGMFPTAIEPKSQKAKTPEYSVHSDPLAL
jgi:uncharacterized protein (TIGR00661 family)